MYLDLPKRPTIWNGRSTTQSIDRKKMKSSDAKFRNEKKNQDAKVPASTLENILSLEGIRQSVILHVEPTKETCQLCHK